MTPGHPLPSGGRCPVCGVDEGRLGLDDALDTIRTLGRRYREAVAGVPPEAVLREPAPSEWSMVDYVAHVREVLELLAADLDIALDQHRPQLRDPDAATSSRPRSTDLTGDLDGLDAQYDDQKIAAALKVDASEWAAEIESIDEWYATIGDHRLPDPLQRELADLKHRISVG